MQVALLPLGAAFILLLVGACLDEETVKFAKRVLKSVRGFSYEKLLDWQIKRDMARNADRAPYKIEKL